MPGVWSLAQWNSKRYFAFFSFLGPDIQVTLNCAMQTQSQTPNKDSTATGALGREADPPGAMPPPPAPAGKAPMLEREANALSSCFKASASSAVFE